MSGVIVSAEDAAREEALKVADQIAASETEDFDAFWANVERKPQVLRNVLGVDVVLPPALPLSFEVMSRAAADSRDPEDQKRMVALLFGEDALDRWTSAGMDLEQFAVLLLWGTVNTRAPRSMTLAQARDTYMQKAAALGKDRNATQPPTGSGVASSATGQPSKRTSRASTTSKRKK